MEICQGLTERTLLFQESPPAPPPRGVLTGRLLQHTPSRRPEPPLLFAGGSAGPLGRLSNQCRQTASRASREGPCSQQFGVQNVPFQVGLESPILPRWLQFLLPWNLTAHCGFLGGGAVHGDHLKPSSCSFLARDSKPHFSHPKARFF